MKNPTQLLQEHSIVRGMEHLLDFTSERRDEGNQTFSLLWGEGSSQCSTRVDLEGCVHPRDPLSGVTTSAHQIMGKSCQSFGAVKNSNFMKSSPMGLWRGILKVGKQPSREGKSVFLQHGLPPDSAKTPGRKNDDCLSAVHKWHPNSPLHQESRGHSPSPLHFAWWNTFWIPGSKQHEHTNQ